MMFTSNHLSESMKQFYLLHDQPDPTLFSFLFFFFYCFLDYNDLVKLIYSLFRKRSVRYQNYNTDNICYKALCTITLIYSS